MRWRLTWRAVLGAALCASVLIGCGRKVPPKPRAVPGYEARVDSLDAVDLTALEGRRIMLDPGHGGFYKGSMGVNGTSEAAINLGVALRLRDLLALHGADVRMTRETNRDFFTPDDSTQRGDLQARATMTNEWNPDLFVSIHHNADAGGRHDVNETQTYYKMGDDGQSLDAAESIHRYLVRNVGIRPHHIRPGNYFVLRNVDAPGVLTESSYITNPDVEERLVLPEKQQLEAEALLLGIGHFFGRGAPVIESFVAKAGPSAQPDTTFDEIGAPVFEAVVSGAFDEVRFTVDGETVHHDVFGQRIHSHSVPALPPGRHVAELHVRRSGHGAARSSRVAFTIHRAPASISLQVWPPALNPRGGPIAVRAEVQDALGFPFDGALEVTFHLRAPGMRQDTPKALRDGVAWVESPPPAADSLRVWVDSGDLRSELTVLFPNPRLSASVWAGLAENVWTGGQLLDALGTREPERQLLWINRNGFVVLPRGPDGGILIPRFPGYRLHGHETQSRETDALMGRDGKSRVLVRDPGWIGPIRWIPIAGGALHGRRITLDPDGGVDDAAGIGPSGTRGSHVSLRIARILRSLLEAAGANVLLTRDGDIAVSEVERVRMSEAFGADRYLRIGFRAEAPRLAHYPGSNGGSAWAGRTADVMASLGFAKPAIGTDAQYPLQQTSCPALYAGLVKIDDAASEEALFEPGALRARAYALYVGLAREWSGDSEWGVDSLRVVDANAEPVAGAAVEFGNGIMLETGPDGWLRFVWTELGPVEATVRNPRVEAGAILLDSTHGATLTGPPGR